MIYYRSFMAAVLELIEQPSYMELFTFVDLQSQSHNVRVGLRNSENLS